MIYMTKTDEDNTNRIAEVVESAFRDVWEPRGWTRVDDPDEIAQLQREQAAAQADSVVEDAKRVAGGELAPGEEDQIRQTVGALPAKGDAPAETTPALTGEAGTQPKNPVTPPHPTGNAGSGASGQGGSTGSGN